MQNMGMVGGKSNKKKVEEIAANGLQSIRVGLVIRWTFGIKFFENAKHGHGGGKKQQKKSRKLPPKWSTEHRSWTPVLQWSDMCLGKHNTWTIH